MRKLSDLEVGDIGDEAQLPLSCKRSGSSQGPQRIERRSRGAEAEAEAEQRLQLQVESLRQLVCPESSGKAGTVRKAEPV